MEDERSRRGNGVARSRIRRPETASRHLSQRSSLAIVLYGVSTGIGTTALGAWSASGITSDARIIVWITVTAILSMGCAWIAAPIIALWIKPLRNEQGLRHPDPR